MDFWQYVSYTKEHKKRFLNTCVVYNYEIVVQI